VPLCWIPGQARNDDYHKNHSGERLHLEDDRHRKSVNAPLARRGFYRRLKINAGWCKMTKQPGVDGSSRGLIMNLLTDHCLLFHKTQKAFLNNKLPARTVGSLTAKICFDSTIDLVRQILQSDNPKEALKKCESQLCEVVELHASAKHAYNWDVGKMGPSPSLEKKYAA